MAERKDYTEEEYALMSLSVHEIVDAFEKEMEEQFGLLCTGQGGSMPYDIQSVKVNFLTYKQLTIEESRELVVRATERFVELFNAHKVIRPYLRDYPWDHNRARVTISSHQENGKDYVQGISFVLQVKEQIFYYGPQKSRDEMGITIKEESYAEAKSIVNNSPSCLKPIEKKKKWFGWL